MPFFTVNQRSNCLFQVNDWCDHFNYRSASAVPEFLCDIVPFTVAVLMPEGGPRAAVWDQIYGVIASVWQDRKVGFVCYRVPYANIVQTKPCEACRDTRRAQIVVLEVDLGGSLEQTYRDMAFSSMHHLLQLSQQPVIGPDVPQKKLILIGEGEARGIAPHVLRICDYVDYSGVNGAPDLEKLRSGMRSLIPAGDEKILTLEFDDMPAPAERGVEIHEKPAASSEEFEIKVVSEGPMPVMAEPTVLSRGAPASRSEPEDRIETRSPGSDLRNLIESLRSGKFDLREVASKAKAAIEMKKAFENARADLQEDPLRVLSILRSQKFDEPDWEGYRKALIDDCLSRLTEVQLVEVFFNQQQVGAPEQAIGLSPTWHPEPCPNNELRVSHSEIRALIGDATSLPVYIMDTGNEDKCCLLLTELYGRLRDRAARKRKPAIIVGERLTQFISIGTAVLKAWKMDPGVAFMRFDLSYIREQIRSGDPLLTYLPRKFQEEYMVRRNLYNFTQVADSGQNQFFGRTQLIKTLTNYLDLSTSFLLYGPSRSGKTSLLQRLQKINIFEDRLVVTVDFQQVAPRSISVVYQAILDRIKDGIVQKYPASRYPREIYPELNLDQYEVFKLGTDAPEASFRRYFAPDLLALSGELRANERIPFQSMILLLDEIESVFPEEKIQSGVKGTDGFLTVMRSVIEKGCAVVWSGYGPVLRARMDGHPIGSSLPHVPIGPLDLDECTDLIRSIGLQGSIYYEDASIESIFQYSGGVPYWTKKLCSHIFDEMEASPASPEVRVQTRDVLQAVDGLVRRDNAIRRFVSQYRRYYPHEIARVRELAQHYEVGKRFSEKDLSGSGLEAADVSNLIDYGWLRETKGEYQIAVGLFHKWFRSAGAGT